VKEKGQGGHDQKPTSQNNAYLKEQRRPSSGFPNSQPEQPLYGGATKNSERQAVPSVWDVVERKWRFFARELPMTTDEHFNERSEIWRLEAEIEEKGTLRAKLILDLFTWGVILRPDPERRTLYKPLLPEDLQQFRSLVERSSDEELAEELRKHEPNVKPPNYATGTF
jgi:hypothetical protein